MQVDNRIPLCPGPANHRLARVRGVEGGVPSSSRYAERGGAGGANGKELPSCR